MPLCTPASRSLSFSFSPFPRTHREAIVVLGLLDDEEDAVGEAVALQGRGRAMMLPITFGALLLLLPSCFAAKGKGLVAVFRGVFGQRRLRRPRERCSPAVGRERKRERGGSGEFLRDLHIRSPHQHASNARLCPRRCLLLSLPPSPSSSSSLHLDKGAHLREEACLSPRDKGSALRRLGTERKKKPSCIETKKGKKVMSEARATRDWGRRKKKLDRKLLDPPPRPF